MINKHAKPFIVSIIIIYVYFSNFLLFNLYSGARHCATRRSFLTLIFGVFVGFSLAVIFVSSPPRGSWIPYAEPHHEVELHDPHTGGDLADAAGPELDVG